MRELSMKQVLALLTVAGLWGVGNAPAQTISGEHALMNRTGPGPGISATAGLATKGGASIEPSRALLGRSSRPDASVVILNTKPGDSQVAVSPERALLARVRD